MTGRDEHRYMIECKYTDKDYIYLDPSEVKGLKLFAHESASTPVVALREKQDTTWRLVHVDDIPKPGKNYKVSRGLVREMGVEAQELFDAYDLPSADKIMTL